MYIAFDIVYLDDRPTTHLALRERHRLLAALLQSRDAGELLCWWRKGGGIDGMAVHLWASLPTRCSPQDACSLLPPTLAASLHQSHAPPHCQLRYLHLG